MSQDKTTYELYQRRYNFVRIWNRRYNHMALRVLGKTTNKSHAAGKEFMTREAFLEWCVKPEVFSEFMHIYQEWASGNWELKLAPSVDRIDPRLGYTEDNIQWLSFSQNCSKNNKIEGCES